jgi:hypothetical protein
MVLAEVLPALRIRLGALSVSTLFNQHVYTSIFIGQTGHTHNRAGDAEDETPTAIDCAACEPFLVREGWVYTPEAVPLTERQVRAREQTEREGNLAVKQVAEALAQAASDAIVGAHRGAGAATATAPRSRTVKKQSSGQ